MKKVGKEFALDKATLGFDGKATQSVLASFEVVDELDDPDNINFLFMADIPREALYESAIIYQWAQLTPKTHAEIGKISIDCKVQVGNPDGAMANVFKVAIEDSTRSGKKWWDFNYETEVHTTIYADWITDDYQFYETKKSTTNFKNELQNCMAILKIPKADRNAKMFQDYDVKYGIRIYASDEDVAPKILG